MGDEDRVVSWLVFAYDTYYPLGAMDDCVYAGPSKDEAQRSALNAQKNRDWVGVYVVLDDGAVLAWDLGL